MSEEKSKSASDDSLSRLSRAVQWSAGMFSLILARCNYAELRRLIIEQLHERCPVQIQEITLSGSGRSLHQLISERVKDGMPDAVMVLGLESHADPDTILRGANQIRGKFGKDFPFPIILWISDSILSKFSRSAPDFYSWAGTSLQFRPSDEEFPDALEKIMEKPMFLVDLATQKLRQGTGTLADLSNPQEFDCFLKDLEALPSSLLAPHGSSRLQFLRGIQLQKSGQSRQAVPYYEECFQNVNPEQEAVLLYLIGKCCDDPKRARNCFQECVRIAGECQELAAKSLCCLCGVLKEQEDWGELGRTGKEALELNRSCNQEAECLQCQLFLAEAALHREDWEAAEAGVRQILDVLSSREADGDWLDPKQSDRVLELVGETVRTKKKQPELEAKFGAMLLNLLHRIYFQQKHYLEAFQAKQERYSLEQEFGLRAFVGAGRLKARRREYTRKISVAEEIEASGRKNNIEELRKKLAEDNCKLIVFHGVSGVGKSSTLEAGLLPALRQELAGKYDAIPVLIRSYTNWTGEVSRRVGDAFAETSEKSEILPPLPDSVEYVLEKLRKVDEQKFLAVLIFDQFEEFFFEHDELGKRREFYDFLKDALNIPAVKIILSLREDYIHYLLECDQYVLEREDRLRIDFDILGKKFRMSLGNFTRDGAKSVIQSLTRRSNFPLDERLIDRIVDDLAEDTDGVRPIELQIVGSQIEAKGIHTDEAFKPKKELIQAFLEEAVQDCGTENEDMARLILWLLTDEKLTRPLKTRAEIEYELRALVRDTGRDIPLRPLQRGNENENSPLREDTKNPPLSSASSVESRGVRGVSVEPISLTLEILTLAGMIFVVPGQTEKYQLVHDYLTGLIREETKPLLERLNEDKNEREYRRRLVEEDEKRQLEHAKEVRALLEQANYNLARVFEEKASIALNRGLESKNPDDFQQAWLYTLTALQQDIGDETLPVSLGRLARSELRSGISPWLWLCSEEYFFLSEVAFSPDGKKLAFGSDKTILLWNVETGEELKRFSGHSEHVRSVAFSPDEKKLVSCSGFRRDDADYTVRLWDVQTGKELIRFTGHSDEVTSVTFSPDGIRIASGSEDNTVRLWDMETGRELATFRGHSDDVNSVSFSPDGTRIASGSDDNTVRLWDVETGRELTTLTGHSSYVFSVSFSPDGKTLAFGSEDNTVRLWDVETGRELTTLTKHSSDVNSVAFSPDGKKLASGSGGHYGDDKTVRVWDVETGRELATFRGHLSDVTSVAFSPDGTRIASGSKDETVRLWDADTDRELMISTEDSRKISRLAFSPDGKMLAFKSEYPRTEELWDIENMKKLDSGSGYKLDDAGKVLSRLDVEKDSKLSSLLDCVAFSPDGKTLASGARDGTARLWDVETGKELACFGGHPFWVLSVAFSPDGRTLASSSDNTVSFWDIETRKELTRFSMHSSDVTSVSFSPDGTRIASGSEDNTVRLWDVETGKERTIFSGHSDSVTSVSFSPDGKILASGSDNGIVRLWKLDLLNDYLKHGKDSPLFQKICEVSFAVFPYRLEGINLVKGKPRRYLPLRGKFHPWQVFARPRPPHKDPVEWMIENLPEEYKED